MFDGQFFFNLDQVYFEKYPTLKIWKFKISNPGIRIYKLNLGSYINYQFK